MAEALVIEPEAPIETVETPKGRGRNPNSLRNLVRVPKGGDSPNPRGRPKKDFELAEEAQKHAALAIKTLSEIAGDAKAPCASRVSAASELLDRAFGRAPQSIKMKHELTFSEQFEEFIRTVNARTIDGSLAAQG